MPCLKLQPKNTSNHIACTNSNSYQFRIISDPLTMSEGKKSGFSVACSRLNQYMKEKRSIPPIGGLNMNTASRTLELKKEQFTIFYSGEVVNFDDIDANKAEGLIAFAASVTEARSNVAVVPMARRKSLQIFLQRRKERISSNAPYSSKLGSSSSTEDYDKKTWLRLGLSS